MMFSENGTNVVEGDELLSIPEGQAQFWELTMDSDRATFGMQQTASQYERCLVILLHTGLSLSG